MNSSGRFASAITRAWVHLYTAGMPEDLRATRCAEVESDLWEHAREALQDRAITPVTLTIEILTRTLLGVPDDLAWRFEAIGERRATSDNRRTPMTVFATRFGWMGLAGVLGGALWAANVLLILLVPAMYRTGAPIYAFGYPLVAVLFIIGVCAAYWQHRKGAPGTLRAGFLLLCLSCIGWLCLQLVGLSVDVPKNVGITLYRGIFETPTAVAFLLIGIGTRGLIRATSIAVACVGFLLTFLPRALPLFSLPGHPSYAASSGPLSFTLLVGVGLILIGRDVIRGSRRSLPSSTQSV